LTEDATKPRDRNPNGIRVSEFATAVTTQRGRET